MSFISIASALLLKLEDPTRPQDELDGQATQSPARGAAGCRALLPAPSMPRDASGVGRRLPRPGVQVAELADGVVHEWLPPWPRHEQHISPAARASVPSTPMGATGCGIPHPPRPRSSAAARPATNHLSPAAEGVGRLSLRRVVCNVAVVICVVAFDDLRCFMCCHLMFHCCFGQVAAVVGISGILHYVIWDVWSIALWCFIIFPSCLGCCRTW